MLNLRSPPDHLRGAFRDFLIQHGGTFGLSGLGYAEEIMRFKFYLETFEQFISKQESKELASLEAQAEKLSKEGQGEFWSWYYPVHWDEIFRTNLRSSFLISIVSFIELQLTEVCRNVAIIARTPIEFHDLRRGSLWEKARLFLERFGGFQRPTNDTWTKFSQIYDVRNVFVHHGGFLPGYRHEKRARQFIQSSNMLTEEHGFLTLKQEFCHMVLESAQLFLKLISEELSALCGRQKLEDSKSQVE